MLFDKVIACCSCLWICHFSEELQIHRKHRNKDPWTDLGHRAQGALSLHRQEQRQIASIKDRGSRLALNPGSAILQAYTAPTTHRFTNDGNTDTGLSSVNSNPAHASGPRGPITLQERQRRLDNGLCLYGCSGHISRNCPLKKASKERKALLRLVNFGLASASKTPINSDAGTS